MFVDFLKDVNLHETIQIGNIFSNQYIIASVNKYVCKLLNIFENIKDKR